MPTSRQAYNNLPPESQAAFRAFCIEWAKQFYKVPLASPEDEDRFIDFVLEAIERGEMILQQSEKGMCPRDDGEGAAGNRGARGGDELSADIEGSPMPGTLAALAICTTEIARAFYSTSYLNPPNTTSISPYKLSPRISSDNELIPLDSLSTKNLGSLTHH